MSKKCVKCGAPNPSSNPDPCSYHVGKPQYLGTADAREDYLEIYFWPCCGKRETGSCSNGSDIPPPVSPGCVTFDQHQLTATAALVYNEKLKSVCEDSVTVLELAGVATQAFKFGDTQLEPLASFDVVAFLLEDAQPSQTSEIIKSIKRKNPEAVVLLLVHPQMVNSLEYQASGITEFSGKQVASTIENAVSRQPRIPRGVPADIFVSHNRIDSEPVSYTHLTLPTKA